MQGNVLGFDPDTNSGAISGYDGQRYDFVRLDWRGPSIPVGGAVVDFVPEGARATRIYPIGRAGNPAEGDTATTIYILYLISLLVGVTGLVGLIMAYVHQSDAPEWVRSHYRFQIRTFWIGLLYIVISLVTAIIVIGVVLWVLTVIWLIVRCIKGMQAVSCGEPYPAPANWIW
ncbi:MAG TPA: DUF4870 domain-containing protein [Stellaceae bacterium]|nr:DUF4870 domain-containing protein [Stellaceae bacterium]